MKGDDPLGWIAGALDDLVKRDLHRSLRDVAGGPDAWIELDVGGGTPGTPTRRVLHLCSNGYLGLATHPEVVAAAAEAAQRFGTGTGASRLVTGTQSIHRDFERELAAWKGHGDAALLSSGYLANLAVVTALVGPGDTIVSDQLNHASIVDACRLARAQTRIYNHGDVDHAAALLADAPGRRVLVTDGVFSMDGDLAPLAQLCEVAARHGAAVVVDDAHGSGVIGPDGRGTAAALGCEDGVAAIVGTLSKSLGSTGGYVAASSEVVDWLRNRARPFIFDTAPGAPSIAAAAAALEVARREPARRQHAVAMAQRLARGLRDRGHTVGEVAACIVPVMVGDNAAALATMDRLLADDVLAVAIRPPSVPVGTARLRATTMSTHTEDDIDLAIAAIDRALRHPSPLPIPHRPASTAPAAAAIRSKPRTRFEVAAVSEVLGARLGRGFVVTGTDTGVGKTVVSALLCAAAQAVYVKPVQSGADEGDDDAAVVAELARVPTVVGRRLGEPLAPAVAGRRAGLLTSAADLLDPILRAMQAHPDRPVVIEGAGGLLVELATDGTTLADLAERLELPVVVVARPGLGTLNHTLLTLEACDRRGLRVAGIVVSGMPVRADVATATNLAELDRLSGGRLAGVVPALCFEGAITADVARGWVAPELGGTWCSSDGDRATLAATSHGALQ